MMLYLILLITAVCTTVCGTSQDGDTQYTWRALDLCKIREGCQGIALSKPSPSASSLIKDLCRAVGDELNSLDPSTCESLLSGEAQDQADKDEPHPDDIEDQLPQTDLASLALISGRTNYFTDCSQIHTALSLFNAVSSGVYDILPVGMTSPISVYCDQTTDGGGWTVIQRRFDGSIDFNRPWADFRNGFGSSNGEQWLGLENMYHLTDQNAYELYIEMEDWDSVVKYARYSSFSVGGGYNYRLSVGGYSGTAGDGFYLSDSSHNYYQTGQAFSARNVDRDAYNSGSCAAGHGTIAGGWWYKSCGYSALNGPYLRPSDHTGSSGYGIFWSPFGGSYNYYLKKSKMMVRPANFQP
ncbi:PREDICTED: ficolin-2-like [Branchiostoma belcheri]|uniref:Ficolin-2-like n=1 Tax=Branchiostoma belcheri TaxID=7741 RepID=A0A6P4YCN8_BRABE|nr:PREDICTED: ficolin-2-like [Branchiostoma belcheri]